MKNRILITILVISSVVVCSLLFVFLGDLFLQSDNGFFETMFHTTTDEKNASEEFNQVEYQKQFENFLKENAVLFADEELNQFVTISYDAEAADYSNVTNEFDIATCPIEYTIEIDETGLKEYIKNLNKDVTIYGKACPLFVPLVEEGLWEDPVTDEIARRYLTELIDIDIDTLILGCTHYPLIRSTLGRIMGDKVTLVNPAYETAIELKQMLARMDMLNDETPALGSNKYQFYVSDKAEKFVRFANSIIKYGILSAKTINIEEY